MRDGGLAAWQTPIPDAGADTLNLERPRTMPRRTGVCLGNE